MDYAQFFFMVTLFAHFSRCQFDIFYERENEVSIYAHISHLWGDKDKAELQLFAAVPTESGRG
jgi:hypothetical protein